MNIKIMRVQQVKRNAKRFPGDFMFQLTSAEAEALRSQIVISKEGRDGRRYAPYVFTAGGRSGRSSNAVSPISHHLQRAGGS